MQYRVLNFAHRFDTDATPDRQYSHKDQHSTRAYPGNDRDLYLSITGFDGQDYLTVNIYDHGNDLAACLIGVTDDDFLENLTRQVIEHHRVAA